MLSLYSSNPIISKEISGNIGKSRGPSAEAIKIMRRRGGGGGDGGATVGRRRGDGGFSHRILSREEPLMVVVSLLENLTR